MGEEKRPRKILKLGRNETTSTSSTHTDLQLDSIMTEPIQLIQVGMGDATDGSSSGAPNENSIGDVREPSHDQSLQASAATPMSKNQLKKLQRQQRWEAGREYRKAKRKEKNILRRERRRVAAQESANHPKRSQLRSVLLPVTLVIDCSYDDLMLDKERMSLGSQLTRSYSDNSKAVYKSHLVISSFGKLLKERFDTALAKMHENWKGVRFVQEDFVHAAELAKDWMTGPQGGKMESVFAKRPDARPDDGEVVYLTSDSPDTLTELKPYSTYIIGGLVDKNRHKGICYKSAMERGIRTAKLPIGNYMQLSTRPVLATNHVVEIMLKWLECGNWEEAFIQVIPKRKGGVLKREINPNDDEGDEEVETAAVLKADYDSDEASCGNVSDSDGTP